VSDPRLMQLRAARETFSSLVESIRPELLRYCARMMGSTIDGEDVVQEAFQTIESNARTGPSDLDDSATRRAYIDACADRIPAVINLMWRSPGAVAPRSHVWAAPTLAVRAV
jgi:DNA-directed RNA polymerase specialized sigma24 family protein